MREGGGWIKELLTSEYKLLLWEIFHDIINPSRCLWLIYLDANFVVFYPKGGNYYNVQFVINIHTSVNFTCDSGFVVSSLSNSTDLKNIVSQSAGRETDFLRHVGLVCLCSCVYWKKRSSQGRRKTISLMISANNIQWH